MECIHILMEINFMMLLAVLMQVFFWILHILCWLKIEIFTPKIQKKSLIT